MRNKHTTYCMRNGRCRFFIPFQAVQRRILMRRIALNSGAGLTMETSLHATLISYGLMSYGLSRGHNNSTPVIGTNVILYNCKYLGKGDNCARTAIIEATAVEAKAAKEQKRHHPFFTSMSHPLSPSRCFYNTTFSLRPYLRSQSSSRCRS
jgi:alanine racemase